MAARFAAEPDVGLLQLRVAPSSPGVPPRDWVPRLRVGDPARSSDVTAVWEGAVAMPRAVFEQVGGWPAEFRYAHEGIDLAWRVLDTGRACSTPATSRPRTPSTRRRRTTTPPTTGRATASGSRAATSRCPLGVLYVLSFALRTLPLLWRSRAKLREARAATATGCAARAGPASRCV